MADLADYDYELPRDFIAQQPLNRRSDARLLHVDRVKRSFEHRHVRDLPEILRPGDCLVINDSRVVPARLIGVRSQTGGKWEGLFVSAQADGAWRLLCKTRGKLVPGESITLLNHQGEDDVRLALLEKLPGGLWAALPLADEETFSLLDRVGRVPLPPYIRGGEMLSDDRERYQTVYARQNGSIAAPTAGLHFTDALLDELTARGVRIVRVTLHVGLGTFKPIQSKRIEEHEMHAEWGEIGADAVATITACRASGGRIVAVGSTSLRLLESASAGGELQPWRGESTLFIKPGYHFRCVDGLLTNFHLPRTTLLVLVRVFGGDDLIHAAYREAINERYRFYSYGDAMLILQDE